MTKKLKCILLVDDSEAFNYIHQMAIEDLACADSIAVAGNGEEALEYLLSCDAAENVMPELILLDINMPAMDGWEFLKAYEQLDNSIKQLITIVMVSTSMNPSDKEKAECIPEVSSFLNKPLEVNDISSILHQFF